VNFVFVPWSFLDQFVGLFCGWPLRPCGSSRRFLPSYAFHRLECPQCFSAIHEIDRFPKFAPPLLSFTTFWVFGFSFLLPCVSPIKGVVWGVKILGPKRGTPFPWLAAKPLTGCFPIYPSKRAPLATADTSLPLRVLAVILLTRDIPFFLPPHVSLAVSDAPRVPFPFASPSWRLPLL